VAHGNLGRSSRTRQPVASEIGQRFMPTLLLTLFAMIWATLVGGAIGVISGVRRGRWHDQAGMVLAVSGISFPSFWLGLLLIDLFAVRLGWLPTGGYGTWQHFVLPSFTLGVAVAAVLARFTRSAFVEVAAEDFVRTARAKGLPERMVIWKHTLRNALIPVITMTGLQFGFLLGGAVVVETVFAWPGLGRLLVDSVSFRDYPVIQAVVLLFSLEFILINLAVDLLYAVVNPEIRLR
ncbi:MAG: ABC transporter permease subunit, partial [Acetobacteraceae bacterium]|nr:ABC transporter permease subunit [Acetobacteraceae bacterium]